MSYSAYSMSDDVLVSGVLARRSAAWIIDLVLVAILTTLIWWALWWFGLLTLGLGFGAMALLPLVPFAYSVLSLLSTSSATPGQQLCDLTVRRSADLGDPTVVQAIVSTAAFHLTMATSGLLLITALFTTRHRTLHDLVSGLVVVRVGAMDALAYGTGHWAAEPYSP